MDEKIIGEITQKADGVVEWQISYESLYYVDGRWFFSDSFSGGEWSLFIRLQCKGRGRSERIELMLIRQNVALPPLDVDYVLSVKDRNGHRLGEQRYRMNFEDYDEGPWIPIYLEDETMLVPNSSLTVLCHIERIDPALTPAPLPKTRILRDLKQMFLNQEDCDVVIRVKEREFKAHSFILKARSPVLASALRSDMREKATGIVVIEDLDPSAFSDFLCYLYCEEVDRLSVKNVFGLFTAADKYDVPDLRAMCIECMKRILSAERSTTAEPSTFCDIIRLALLHSETELIEICTDFFIDNATEIIKSVEWQTFKAKYPTQANELFLKL